MARAIRMRPQREFPRGARRQFLEEVFFHYRAAGRPTLREIDQWIRAHDELAGTASRETIRRVLQGTSVPPNWRTVEAIVLALCDLAGRDPAAPQYGLNGERESHYDVMRRLWNEALDEGPALADPWADEPPF